MKQLRYQLADVVTERAFGGNSVAVFPDARGLDGRGVRIVAEGIAPHRTPMLASSFRRRRDPGALIKANKCDDSEC
jgi:hypothetical protein